MKISKVLTIALFSVIALSATATAEARGYFGFGFSTSVVAPCRTPCYVDPYYPCAPVIVERPCPGPAWVGYPVAPVVVAPVYPVYVPAPAPRPCSSFGFWFGR